ncbi:MAG: hypothetical protein M1821_001036 [Bathelium mastoideum]|nr:MAG: hypothetical protein M1821_001036 [Bathelium mastoideum]
MSVHARYGQAVRVAPDELSFTDGCIWKDVYGHRKQGKDSFPKDLRHYLLASPVHPDVQPMITVLDDLDHGRVRKVFANAFSTQSLKKQVPLLMQHINRFVGVIREQGSSKFDIVSFFNFVTFDIMGDLAFGEPLGLFDGNEYYIKWVTSLGSEAKFACFLKTGVYYPSIMKILQLMIPKSLKEEHLQIFQNAYARVDRRLAKQTDRPDFWTFAEREDENGKPALSLEEMHTNAQSFTLAGTETLSTLLSGLTYLLLKNSDKLKILTDEIRGTFTSEDDMTVERLGQLKYLTACLQEALRLYPPVPFGLGRFAPKDGAMVGGYWIPGGTTVVMEHYATYHDPINFRLPDNFIPERWFDPAFNTDQKAAFEPFATGPRNCIGKNLAWYEMRVIAAKLFFNFDLRLQEESTSWMNQKAYILWMKPPLMVTASPVKH